MQCLLCLSRSEFLLVQMSSDNFPIGCNVIQMDCCYRSGCLEVVIHCHSLTFNDGLLSKTRLRAERGRIEWQAGRKRHGTDGAATLSWMHNSGIVFKFSCGCWLVQNYHRVQSHPLIHDTFAQHCYNKQIESQRLYRLPLNLTCFEAANSIFSPVCPFFHRQRGDSKCQMPSISELTS